MTRTWCAVVPQKALSHAKGRLALPPEQRRAVSIAMLRDTLGALEATPEIERTWVVWGDVADGWSVSETDSVRYVPARGLDLNQAIERGGAWARRSVPDCAVLVVPSDLPALLPTQLSLLLSRAGHHPRAFLPDMDRIGTTILTAGVGASLDPGYGPGSRDRHLASGACELSGFDLDTVRRDVDDLATLTAAFELGCGPHMTAVLRDIEFRPTGLEPTG